MTEDQEAANTALLLDEKIDARVQEAMLRVFHDVGTSHVRDSLMSVIISDLVYNDYFVRQLFDRLVAIQDAQWDQARYLPISQRYF